MSCAGCCCCCGCGPRRAPSKRGRGGSRPSRPTTSRSKSTRRSTSRAGSGSGCRPRSRNRSKSRGTPSKRGDGPRRSGSPNSKDRCSLNKVVPIWNNLGSDPDLQALFSEYDKKYFWGMLSKHGVAVEWSKRLKSTVGTCSADDPPRIRISEPLLKLRPVRDLVETLLHEMIHAYLEVTDEYESEEHGPKFHKHMRRIDKLTGTHITINHDFHDEVELNQYEWRCDGPCKKTVKHCYNKPPGPSDAWWDEHLHQCGGTFVLKYTPNFSASNQNSSRRSPLANIVNV